MGYYTSYKLDLDDVEQPGSIIEELRESSEGAEYALEANGDTGSSTKWYEWEEEMTEFSKKHRGVLFALSGEGEESGDIWKCYFRNGQSQLAKAEIIIAEFDPGKMA